VTRGGTANTRLLVDGAPRPEGPNVRQGIVRDTNGNPMLVVWVAHEATGPVTFTVQDFTARPVAASMRPPKE